MSRILKMAATANPPPATDPPAAALTVAPDRPPTALAAALAPLLLDIKALAVLLSRSAPSLHRDDAAGRLPAPLRIGGSKRWKVSDIELWVAWDCPPRAEFEARRRNHR